MNKFLTYNAKILDIKPLTHDSKQFTLFWEEMTKDYKPGQYLILSFTENGQEVRRSYSITSWDYATKTVKFIVKRIDNGLISRQLVDIYAAGDALHIVGVNGLFTIPDNIAHLSQAFFFAAGSGIAPMIPMITYLLNNSSLKVNLLYSAPSASGAIYYDELQQLSEEFPTFNVDYLFSSTGPIGSSRLNNTLLTRYLNEKKVGPSSSAICFVCGPLDYMDTVTITLLTEGFLKSNIKKELFYNSDISEMPIPEDTAAHRVTIHFQNGTQSSFQVQYPTSILDTALKSGLNLPYSCGSGQCGSCTAKCISGKVWMANNEVLTDRELSQGYVLTCLGFPIEGDVILSF